MKFQIKLLSIFLVSLSILRVDLSFGLFNFNLTPSIVSSLILILYFIIISNSRKIKRPPIVFSFFILISFIILLFFGINLLFQAEIGLQFKRYILFSFVILSSIIFIILYHQNQNKQIIVNTFIKNSFYIYLIFSSIQIYFFLKGEFFLTHDDLIPGISLLPQTIGHFFPRLTGGLLDPNVAGYFLIFMYLLSQKYKAQEEKRKYFVLLIFLTLSRSAIGAFLFIWMLNLLLNFLQSNFIPRISAKKLIRSMVLIITSIVLVSALFNFSNLDEKLIQGINARLTNKDSSTSTHIKLVEIALNKPLEKPFTALFGFGLFSSSIYTSEVFNSKYGNFHSEYLTIFFENGIIGFLLYSLLFVVPLFLILYHLRISENKFVLLLFAALVLENVFYQQYLFSYYWVIIAFLWYHLSLSFFSNTSYDLHKC